MLFVNLHLIITLKSVPDFYKTPFFQLKTLIKVNAINIKNDYVYILKLL